jgi:hypothetical protein
MEKNRTMIRKKDYLKKILVAVVFVVCLTGFAKAQQSGFGVGLMFGEPTGLSFKGWISERSAIDGGLGWSFAHDGAMHIHVDYLYHFYNVFDSPRIPLYLGVGGRIKLQNTEHNSDMRLGIRIPFGIAYQFTEVPLDVFLEIAPVMDLNPKTEGSINGAVGVRLYFR